MIINNVNMVLADEIMHGALYVKNGIIEDISHTQSALAQAIDGQNAYLVPGCVEVHTDNMDLCFAPRPGTMWPSYSAMNAHDGVIASAGITTVLNALSVGDFRGDGSRAENLERMVEMVDVFQQNAYGRVDHYLHLRCEVSHEGTVDKFQRLVKNSHVRLVSLMDHSPGQRQYVSLSEYKKYYQKNFTSETDLETYIQQQQQLSQQNSRKNRVCIADYCNDRGIVLASHDDALLTHVEESHALNNTIAEFPTTMEAAVESHKRGMYTVMGAPNVVRGGSHNGNLASHKLATEGVLDILSSDYFPASLLESAFILADDKRNDMRLYESIKLVSTHPAKILGMDDRGEIALGKRADLVLCRPQKDVLWHDMVWVKGKRVL